MILRRDSDPPSARRSSLLAIGLRVTVRHYYDFGADRAVVGTDLGTPESWDRLRAGTTSPFSIPETREDFVRAAEANGEIAGRARAIDAWLTDRGAGSLASYGVGGGMLEWWLHRLRPDRAMQCTDYAPATVARVNDLAPELSVCSHDLTRDDPLDAELHLFHRIDTELSNREWRDVFLRFGADSILVVASDVLTVKRLAGELVHRPRVWMVRASRAGFLRTESALEALWLPTHLGLPVLVRDLRAWSLTPRGSSAERGTSAV